MVIKMDKILKYLGTSFIIFIMISIIGYLFKIDNLCLYIPDSKSETFTITWYPVYLSLIVSLAFYIIYKLIFIIKGIGRKL